jgi:hypothetical protein
VLVVADQPPLRISGERCFTGAGKSEEQRRVPGLAQVRGAVHGEDIAGGEEKVHHSENRLLHLAGILRAPDKNDATGEIGNDEGAGMGAVTLRHSLELRCGNHGKFSFVACQLIERHANE